MYNRNYGGFDYVRIPRWRKQNHSLVRASRSYRIE